MRLFNITVPELQAYVSDIWGVNGAESVSVPAFTLTDISKLFGIGTDTIRACAKRVNWNDCEIVPTYGPEDKVTPSGGTYEADVGRFAIWQIEMLIPEFKRVKYDASRKNGKVITRGKVA